MRALGQADWLDPKLPNVARMLKDAGYATAHIGKWHLGGGRDIGDAPRPTAYGFDQSFTTFEGLGPRVLVSDEERDLAEQSGKLGNGATFWEIKTRLTGLYCDMAVDFVAQHADQPWFVNLWFNDVHDPWAPGDDALSEVMGKGSSSDDDRYLATLVKMDKTLGRLFERLEQMGEMDNTLIVFTSDNGPSSMQRYYQKGETAPGSVSTLRGRKWSNYEGGIRQPLILYWRGHMQAGYRDERTVGHGVDLLPTLASIAGAPAPAGAEGIDLSPVLRGRASPPVLRCSGLWQGRRGKAAAPAGPAARRGAPLRDPRRQLEAARGVRWNQAAAVRPRRRSRRGARPCGDPAGGARSVAGKAQELDQVAAEMKRDHAPGRRGERARALRHVPGIR
jgi:arylsulfatase A-like enzyme